MTGDALRLVPLSRGHAPELIEMGQEFRDEGDERFATLLTDADAFFAHIDRFARGVSLPPDRVRQTQFLLFRGTRLLGCARLRHRLIPVLHLDGGNIGYEIRRSERGRGYGTAMLALMLEQARGIGLDRVLLTTGETNVASQRVIERNGGVPDGTSVSPNTGETMRRYWIVI